MRRLAATLAVLVGSAILVAGQAPAVPATPDKLAAKWVDDTFRKMTVDEKIGQLVVPAFDATYLASDSAEYERLSRDVTVLHVGGFHVFGGKEAVPAVLLGPAYGATILGDPFAAASLLNRLQALASIPLLNTSDFEAGVGFRLAGATVFPRQMAVGAAGDETLAFQAAKITAIEARAVGVHVDFSPIADVNNNPRNPVINVRSFGERPAEVGRLVAAYVNGLHAGGVLATVKHFPGHGDTDVDSHLGLPIIHAPKDRLTAVELPPFEAGLAAGADAVMTAHIELPALDPGDFSPASLSQPIVTGLLRTELKFGGLVYTDSMSMDAITAKLTPDVAAARAIEAGDDVVLQPPDEAAAVAGLKAALGRGELTAARVDESVRRILTAKARLGLYKTRAVPLDDIPRLVGGRQHAAVADALAAKAITLIKDDRNQVPLRAPADQSVLYLSVLDYPANWSIAAPSRTMVPELKKRWPALTAIELSDHSTAAELDLVRTTAPHYDAIVAGVFVRAASGSGRMDLAPPLAALLTDLARSTARTPRPFVTVLFGNPYVASAVPTLPAVLLTYDFYDRAEAAAVHALAGEAPIAGHVPIALPGLCEAGFGLVR